MRKSIFVLTVTLLAAYSPTASGQNTDNLKFGFSPAKAAVGVVPNTPASPRSSQDYRVEGAVAGGVIGLTLLSVSNAFAGAFQSKTLGLPLQVAEFLASVGIGAVIGSTFKKGP